MAVIGWASGLGFGWLFTLGTANVVAVWMSPPTLLALGTGQVGILLGLGDHTTAVLGADPCDRCHLITLIVTWLLFAVLRGRLHPVGGLGVALGVDRPAVPRRAALVPAVGDHPAGRVGHPAGLPRDGDRRHAGRRASSGRRPTATGSRCSRS